MDLKHVKRWTRPDNYAGASWPNYYSAGVGQSRESDALERSNFASMLDSLGGETETVLVVEESHWAVGWVQWIAIHESDERALAVADEQLARLENYPALDEDAWSELEYNEAAEYWDSLSPREKVQHAMDIRKRYHWLAETPVWFYGRLSYYDIGQRDDTLSDAILESIRD